MPSVVLEIPSRSAYVGVVRLALASLARSAGLDEEAVDDLKIAVGEACVNAVYANEEAGRAAPVQIEWTEESDRVIVEVSDRGRPDSGEDPVTDALGVAPREVMSMALITQLVDKCEFLPREEGGTRARLVLYTPR